MSQKECANLKPGDEVWFKGTTPVKIIVFGVEPSGRVVYGKPEGSARPRSFYYNEVQKHDPRR